MTGSLKLDGLGDDAGGGSGQRNGNRAGQRGEIERLLLVGRRERPAVAADGQLQGHARRLDAASGSCVESIVDLKIASREHRARHARSQP